MTTYILNSSNENYYRNFKNSIKSNDTFKTYDYKLKGFMKYKGITPGEYSQLIDGKDLKVIEADVIDFIVFLKENHYTSSSQKSYLNALMHFYGINDVNIRRKKISKFLSNDDSIVGINDYNKTMILAMVINHILETKSLDY
jgi:hypothetical protein